ncbi:MAG: xylose isomerase [Oscillospiraceae bacterium]|jgi:xylose isomerase|nr:xylose isomerase [Oscillospiraceae bacterium]
MIFPNVPQVKYEGPESRNPFAFKFYDPDKVISGKTMRAHLKFAMAWWHNLTAGGTDMFGRATIDKSFGGTTPMEIAKARADAGFEFMRKLGIDYFCFHDLDLIAEADTLEAQNRQLDEIAAYIKGKMDATGIKCLWGTTNLTNNPRFMNGAGSSNSADVFARAAANVKKTLDIMYLFTQGGENSYTGGFVFWGGREGYETLWNTDMALERDNVARLMHLAVDYARKIGFNGQFYIEPKPKEPMKHQYDYDAETAIGFLRKYGLDGDFKLNIEANHATLAGHTFRHELRVAADNNMLGSIDANTGDPHLGWDTDEFAYNVYDTTECMYEVLRAGGFGWGGLNFDAKNRRPSNTYEDMFHGFILSMDAFALGLINAVKIWDDGRVGVLSPEGHAERYGSWNSGIGLAIRSGKATLESLSDYALKQGEPQLPGSGRQEYIQNVINQVTFG